MNTFGHLFRCTTWGEAHGKAVGCVVDGCPSGLELSESDIQKELQADIPDCSLGTPRREQNHLEILSGLLENKTLGTPICIVIRNNDRNMADYDHFKDCYRPGHAEYTFHKKYGIYDPHGGGRASGREAIARIAAGAIAKKVLLKQSITFCSRVEELAGLECSTPDKLENAKKRCFELAKSGDSTGGIISLTIRGVPVGVGCPVFNKLHSLVMYALSTIGGVKGVESGYGFDAARMNGSNFNDPFGLSNNEIVLISNNSAGVLGGISTGLDLTFKVAVKPTPSIFMPQQTVNWRTKKEETVLLTGRFDKNFTPRIAPIAEAMAAIVVLD
ncbi:MAG TPA: chorismate synthase, partial [Syntrophomonas sp.]|nr:chorismate synthase [Syntrophomonas sp.]